VQLISEVIARCERKADAKRIAASAEKNPVWISVRIEGRTGAWRVRATRNPMATV
jgi:hypothetical protein